jgi:hypothetical protein
MTQPTGDPQFDVVESGYDIEQVKAFLEQASGDAPSRLHAELLKRATLRIEELEGRLSSEPAAAPGPAGLESKMRDLHAEVGDRIGTMASAYQRLVSELRTMSVSIQELSALSAAMSETLAHVDATGSRAAAPAVDSPFALDVPEERPARSAPAQVEELEPNGAAPGEAEPHRAPGDETALAAVADRLLATLANVEASLDAAVDGDAWMTSEPAPGDADPEGETVESAEADQPEEQAADPADEAEEPEAAAEAPVDTPDPDDELPTSGRAGSFYSRRSAKLPRLADAGQDALAAARSLRGALND